jgi:hypothetical protein
VFPFNVAAAGGGGRATETALLVTAGEDAFNVGYSQLLGYGDCVPGNLWPDDLAAPINLVVSRKTGNPAEVIFNLNFTSAGNTDDVFKELEITGLWGGVLSTRTLLRTSANYTNPGTSPNWSWLTNVDRWTAGTEYDVVIRRT